MKVESSKQFYDNLATPFFNQWHELHSRNKTLSRITLPGTVLLVSILLISTIVLYIVKNFIFTGINLAGSALSSQKYTKIDAKQCLKDSLKSLIKLPIVLLFSPLIVVIHLQEFNNSLYPNNIENQRFINNLDIHLLNQTVEPAPDPRFQGEGFSLAD